MRYFTLNELVKSDTATKKGIDNTPTMFVMRNLTLFVNTLLDDLRSAWGSPLKVTSGYRCPALNKAVGGVENSAHLYGLAVDIVPMNGDFNKFTTFVKKWFRSRTDFDQVIEERAGGSRWVHIGWKQPDTLNQRRQIFDLKK